MGSAGAGHSGPGLPEVRAVTPAWGAGPVHPVARRGLWEGLGCRQLAFGAEVLAVLGKPEAAGRRVVWRAACPRPSWVWPVPAAGRTPSVPVLSPGPRCRAGEAALGLPCPQLAGPQLAKQTGEVSAPLCGRVAQRGRVQCVRAHGSPVARCLEAQGGAHAVAQARLSCGASGRPACVLRQRRRAGPCSRPGGGGPERGLAGL